MEKIRVLRIINRFNIGGPTYNAAYLTKYLPEEYETLLLGGVKDEGEDSSEYILENLGIKPMLIEEMKRPINLKDDYLAYKKVRQIIKEFKPHIVHTHASKAGLVGRLAAIHSNVPIIVHTFHGHVFHSYFGRLKTFVFKSIERYLAKKSTKIIAISKEQKHELADIHKICRSEKIEVIPLGFDLNRFFENQEEKRHSFRTRYNIDENTICVGIIGRLAPIKNHHFFIAVVEKVMQSNLNKKIKFFIIGDGELMNELQQLCKEKNISFETPTSKNKEASIVFTSWIKEVDWALAGLDIVALTSKNEGTPVSLIEAQAAGKSIISTNVGGIKDIMIENETGFLINKEDIDTFASKLLILIENDDIRNKMGQKGKHIVQESHSYRRLTNDVDVLYKKLLQEKFGN